MVIVGYPRLSVSLSVQPTGNKEIDDGLYRVLARQQGVHQIARETCIDGHIVFNLAMEPMGNDRFAPFVKNLAEAIEEYFRGEGVLSHIFVGSDL